MAYIEKFGYMKRLRRFIDTPMLKLPLPRINPDFVSVLGIITSIVFALSVDKSKGVAFAFLVVTLLLDWFDGLIAKKHKISSKRGEVIDKVCDLVSEGIIFSRFINPWFYLFLLNVFLTTLSFIIKKSMILSLRIVFVVYFFLNFIV